jgi:hypothetical protein
MSIIIKNMGICKGKDKDICTYILKANSEEPLAIFTHKRSDGLSECLRKAIRAYEEVHRFRLVKEYENDFGR